MTIRLRGWFWFGVLLGVGLYYASCGHLAYAQDSTSAPVIPAATYYSNPNNLEGLDSIAIRSAQHSIDLAAFSLTDQAIVTELVGRAAHGVKVRIYLDRGELQSECQGDATCARIPLHALIGLPGVEIRVKYSKILMHLKSYEVDSSLVRDGSANFSEQGEAKQDNSAVFTYDPRAQAVFDAKFKRMWERPDNLTVAQALGTNPEPTARKPPDASPAIGQK